MPGGSPDQALPGAPEDQIEQLGEGGNLGSKKKKGWHILLRGILP